MSQQLDKISLKNKVDRLAAAIFSIRPVLGETYERNKELSLVRFMEKQFAGLNTPSVSEDRRNEAIRVISDHTRRILGEQSAMDVTEQLSTTSYAVITADHHGPLTDPGFVNNNLLSAFSANPDQKILLILSCANISFDNDSFPRGHLFHSKKEDQILANQLVFFSRKVRPLTIVYHQAYDELAIIEAKKRVASWSREEIITQAQGVRLLAVIDEIYATPLALSLKSFSDQVTVTNYALWKKVMQPVEPAPDLIYLAQEKIVNSLILQFHLNKSTIIHSLLFKADYSILIMKFFDGISGAFSLNTHSGTYLFWGLPKDQKYRVQLWKKGDALVTEDDSFRVELTPQALEKAIQNEEIIPSTLLSFIVLSFYHGLTLIGGGGQTSYLTKMKDAYLQFLHEVGAIDELDVVQPIATNRQAVPYPSIGFLKSGEELVSTTFLDILLTGDSEALSIMQRMGEKITLYQALGRQFPSLYRAIVPMDQQTEELLAISVKEIDVLTGFADLIEPIGELK